MDVTLSGMVTATDGTSANFSTPLTLGGVSSSPPVTSSIDDVTKNGLVADFNGTTGTDNTAALNALLAACGSGASLYFPNGNYMFAGKVNITNSGVWLRGQSPYSGTRLWFTGSSGNFIDIQGAQYSKISDMTISSNSSFLSGALICVRLDAARTELNRVNIGMVPGAGWGLLLDGSMETSIYNSSFSGGQIGIVGRLTAPSYSNVLNMIGGQFVNQSSAPVTLGGEAWTFNNVTFEARSDGKGVAFSGDSSVPVWGLSFYNCWFGDATVDGGTWISAFGYGVVIEGNHFTSFNTTGTNTAIKLNGVKGYQITGNHFYSVGIAIDYATASCQGGLVQGNCFHVGTFEAHTSNKDSSINVAF